MEIDEIVDYATNSPENTNPAVLRSMLRQLNNGSSSSGGSPYVIEIVYDELLGPKTVKTAAEVYEMYNAASQAGVPFLCGNMEGKVVDAFCEEAGDEADGDLRYVLSVFTMYFPSDSSATEMYYSYYQTAVPIADVNDHPFVFHESSYGYEHYSWVIPITPST